MLAEQLIKVASHLLSCYYGTNQKENPKAFVATTDLCTEGVFDPKAIV